MAKCLILSKLKISDENQNVGFWILVDKEEEAHTINALGERFIFSFDINHEKDEPLLKALAD